jgi:hypothetical protein
MPDGDWFVKTPEMLAADQYFSLDDAGSEALLIGRYQDALKSLAGGTNSYAQQSKALDKEWNNPSKENDSLFHHFLGDWIYYLYYDDPVTYGQTGGAYWPQVWSQTVIDRLRGGMTTAIQKALGTTALASLGVVTDSQLFKFELANQVDISGVVGIANSWTCIAPAGSDFFEVAALRGPTIVEYTIGTPKPYGHSVIMPIVERLASAAQT